MDQRQNREIFPPAGFCQGPLSLCILLLLFLVVGLSAACTNRTESRHTFTRAEQGGVTVARNSAVPLYQGPLFRCEPELTLHEDPERPETLIYNTSGVCRDAEGRYFVLDGGNRRVAVFGPDGEYAGAIGRGGQGPGEFSRSLVSLNALLGDTLMIYDARLRRVTLYSTNGTLLDMKQTPVTGEVYYLPSRDLFVGLRIIGTFENDELCWGQRFTASRSTGDTVGTADTGLVYVKYFVPWPGMTKNNGGLEYLPFTSEPAMALAGRAGVVATMSEPGVVNCWGFDGTLRERIVIDFPEAVVTPDDISAYQRAFDRWVSEIASGEEHYRYKQRSLMVFPEHRTFWRDILVDEAGYYWLEVLEEEFERAARGGGVFYDVLSPDGEYLGRTELPAHGTITGGRLVGIVVDDETGAEIHTVWRLIPAAEGFSYP